MKLSVVATMYRSGPYLDEFVARLARAIETLAERGGPAGDEVEIVLVNDGCPADSLSVALRLQTRDPRIVVVDLSRNFGHHRAIMAGLAEAKGERVFLIDCDLEEPPELLPDFSARLDRRGCDVVFGVQERRKGDWFERLSGQIFYAAFERLTRLDMPRNILTVRLMTRRYVDALLRHEERELFLAGLFHITGFEQLGVPVVKGAKGASTYTLHRKVALFVNSITAFSDRPLIHIFYVGSLISSCAVLAAGYLAYRRLVHDDSLVGWTSLMVSVWLLGGLIILFLGVIGIYLSKVFVETKRRPVLIRQIHRGR